MKYQLRHTTRYDYSGQVSLSHNEVRMLPRSLGLAARYVSGSLAAHTYCRATSVATRWCTSCSTRSSVVRLAPAAG